MQLDADGRTREDVLVAFLSFHGEAIRQERDSFEVVMGMYLSYEIRFLQSARLRELQKKVAATKKRPRG